MSGSFPPPGDRPASTCGAAPVRTSASRPLRRAIVGLGFGQIYAWGTLYYAIAITADTIAADLTMGREVVFFGVTLALIVGAFTAPATGRAIDRFGARVVMGAGAALAAGALGGIAAAQGPATYLAASALAGAAATMTLYDAGFAALVQIDGARGRRAITVLTFFGGFASTVFWPLTAWLMGDYGWRATYAIYAVGALFFLAPLILWALAPSTPAQREPVNAPSVALPVPCDGGAPLVGAARRRAFWLLTLGLAAHQLVIAGLTVHLVGALDAGGLSTRAAIAAGMAFGPAQVAGRLADMGLSATRWGARWPATASARVAAALLPAALALALWGGGSFAYATTFVACAGLSNGVMTIARGSLALALFGPAGYGALMGDLAVASNVARAAGPLAFAYGLGHGGVNSAFVASLLCAMGAVFAMEGLARMDARRRGL